MARTVPGSGAIIKPLFDDFFGVRAVKVLDGGSGYDPLDPPRLTITGCGTPTSEALLYPIIDGDSGKIVHVRVLARGRGYDPLRLQVTPLQETPNIISSFDINRIWQSTSNSQTQAVFVVTGGDVTDRLRITSDNDPKPSNHIPGERDPGGIATINDRNFVNTIVYRGGKNVPFPATEGNPFQQNKNVAILANGGLLHTPDWGQIGSIPVGLNVDHVKYPHLKNTNVNYDTIISNNIYHYQTSKLINEFSYTNGVFEWGKVQPFVWKIKVEFDNILIPVTGIDETLSPVSVGRIVEVAGKTIRGSIAKIVRDNTNSITKVYLRAIGGTGEFEPGDLCLGDTGFTFKVSGSQIDFPSGIFYIDFGDDAEEFGNFAPNTWYFSPENIRVQRNYQIIWDQSDPSNASTNVHLNGHPMQFSTTQDGLLNGGTLYYNSTGVTQAPVVDYENEFQPTFIMSPDENNRIYYYCKYHRYMSGYTGDEGYMVLDPEVEDEPLSNNYYYENYYQSDSEDPNTIDRSRHPDGHSKIVGVSFDGYPIYGPYGYDDSGNVIKQTSSYRYKTTIELPGNRPIVTTEGLVTKVLTIADSRLNVDGVVPAFLQMERGKTYVFDASDASMENQIALLSITEDGWHAEGGTVGDVSVPYGGIGVEYRIDGDIVEYQTYLSLYAGATSRELRITPSVDSPGLLFLFTYQSAGNSVRNVISGNLIGDFIEDYIYDSAVGTLDAFNGKFGVTPEYPNGTYAYFLSEDGSGNPTYPYAIGPKFYGVPVFEGETPPEPASVFPTEVDGDVVLDELGRVSYVKMTRKGDNYFGPAEAKILGGEGSGATATPIVQTVTGLTLLNSGRSYERPPTLVFEGGGGEGAKGAASIDTLGRLTNISIVDPGEFYQSAPYILVTGGGGIGAKAEAIVNQGQITAINILDEGTGYTSPPNIIFTRLVNLKRKTRSRQAFNSSNIYLTGLVKTVDPSDTNIYVNSTDSFPGSGTIFLNNETIAYTAKSAGRFFGLTRGVNFNYDQRVILDDGQDINGVSTYEYNVGDRVIRRVDNASNKVAKVYDWNPASKELLVTFEVDELAFIDAGIPSTEDAVVQFDAGVAGSTGTGVLPHTVIEQDGSSIPLLTNPVGSLADSAFEDDDELEGVGNGIPDLINTSTDFENQINLEGGIYNSLYGIEETQGGQNTTLFQVGDSIKDASLPFKYATVISAGGLSDGVDHEAALDIYLDAVTGNGLNFAVNEIVTGAISGVRATVVSWNPVTAVLRVNNVVPYNTGNVNIGIAGYFYKFSENGSVIGSIIHAPGTNYTSAPTVTIENNGFIEATATAVMTSAGDQVQSLSITNGGYELAQNVDNAYQLHPTITFTPAVGDTTGSGASAQAILGGELLNGAGGGIYRIKRIDYQTIVRS